MEVEISLRIPNVKDPLKGPDGWPVVNGEVRFAKRLQSPKLPKPGDIVDLTTRPDVKFQATVIRADWHEEKELFVVACRYLGTSIPRENYLALMADDEWTRRPLLPQ